jgi:carboxyl-terminal processing protease
MQDFFRKNWTLISAIIVIAISFYTGFYFGQNNTPAVSQVVGIDNKESDISSTTDFSTFWKVWNVLNEKYVPTHSTTTPSNQVKVYGAIQGLAASYGDPYTVFFPPVENQGFQDQISGSFEGVGMEVDVRDGVLTVIAPLKGTPAYNAGIKSGDKILAINKKSTQGLSTESAIKLIKGKKGTIVTFLVLRNGKKDPFEIPVVRDVISVPTVETEMKGDVFVIHMYTFTATSPDLFRNALRTFIQSGKTKLVVDLRGNPGGYLDAAVDMASWFLPSGDIIVSEKSKNPADNQDYRSKGYNIFGDSLKMAILIDGGSASASEILSGGLRDHNKAILIGAQSYGKGSVQELVPITSDTSLKVTIAKWYTPNGISISTKGLTPDVKVDIDAEKYIKNGEDTQIEKAIEVLDNENEYAQAMAGTYVNPATATTTPATSTPAQ